MKKYFLPLILIASRLGTAASAQFFREGGLVDLLIYLEVNRKKMVPARATNESLTGTQRMPMLQLNCSKNYENCIQYNVLLSTMKTVNRTI